MAEQTAGTHFPRTTLDKILVIFGAALGVALVLIWAFPLVPQWFPLPSRRIARGLV